MDSSVQDVNPSVRDTFVRRAGGFRESFDELLDLDARHRVAAVLVVHRGQSGRRPAWLVREVEVAVGTIRRGERRPATS